MARLRWRFVSELDPKAVIVVHDKVSADSLVGLFQGRIRSRWTLHTEREDADDVEKLRLELQAAPGPLPAPAALAGVPLRGIALEMPKDIPTSDPAAVGTRPGSERRRAPRFKLRFWVTIISGPKSFQSFTKDISLTGLSLEKKIPTHVLGSHCRIYIHGVTTGERIELMGRVLADARAPRRFRFLELTEKATNLLRQWIEERLREAEAEAAAEGRKAA